jgi:hypothetical protein
MEIPHFAFSLRSSSCSGSFGTTGHLYVVGGRSGDSQVVSSSSIQFFSANRRFFPFTPETRPVIPNEVRNLFDLLTIME